MTRSCRLSRLLCFISILFLAGCNDEVFISGPILPDRSDFTIDGDDGEATFKATLDRLEDFGISLEQWVQPSRLVRLDAAGDTLSADAPASLICRMVYETHICSLELLREGNSFTVRSLSNATGQDLSWSVRLNYAFGSKTVHVTTLPGKPLLLLDISYGSIFDAGNFSSPVRLHIDNETSDSSWDLNLYPFLNSRARISVDPVVSWLSGSVVRMEVPVCDADGIWSLSQSKYEVELGQTSFYDGPDPETAVPFTVPPHVSCTAETLVIYAKAEMSGTLHMLNQALGSEFDIPFTATAAYPHAYTPVQLIPN